MPRPIPLLPPVTMTVFPCSDFNISHLASDRLAAPFAPKIPGL
jgi:hypothetical protein